MVLCQSCPCIASGLCSDTQTPAPSSSSVKVKGCKTVVAIDPRKIVDLPGTEQAFLPLPRAQHKATCTSKRGLYLSFQLDLARRIEYLLLYYCSPSGSYLTMWLLSPSIFSRETSRSAVDGTPSCSIYANESRKLLL